MKVFLGRAGSRDKVFAFRVEGEEKKEVANFILEALQSATILAFLESSRLGEGKREKKWMGGHRRNVYVLVTISSPGHGGGGERESIILASMRIVFAEPYELHERKGEGGKGRKKGVPFSIHSNRGAEKEGKGRRCCSRTSISSVPEAGGETENEEKEREKAGLISITRTATAPPIHSARNSWEKEKKGAPPIREREEKKEKCRRYCECGGMVFRLDTGMEGRKGGEGKKGICRSSNHIMINPMANRSERWSREGEKSPIAPFPCVSRRPRGCGQDENKERKEGKEKAVT